MEPSALTHDDGFYAVLGLSRGAGTEEVTSAYRRLALRHHPDKTGSGHGASTAAFQAIQEAYGKLSDPVWRLVYDEALQRGPVQTEVPPHQTPPSAETELATLQVATNRGGLIVSTCLLTGVGVLFCGTSAILGGASCGAGRLLLQSDQGGTRDQSGTGAVRRGAAALFMGLGLLLVCGSPVVWTLGLFAAIALGLAVLAAQWKTLPDLLPYFLFAGYFFLYLLAPTCPGTPSVRVDIRHLDGLVVLEENLQPERSAETMVLECAAALTWVIVLVHWLQVRSQLHGKAHCGVEPEWV